MAFNDLFLEYPNRNSELRSVAKSAYDFGLTIAAEPSSAAGIGMDSHALERQRSYVEYETSLVEAIHAEPIPDNPAVHPTDLPINLSVAYTTFVEDVNGQEVPINESTQLVAEKWMMIAVALAKSQSAAIQGSLIEHDYKRAINNLESLSKVLDEIEKRPSLDLPENAKPGAPIKRRSGGK